MDLIILRFIKRTLVNFKLCGMCKRLIVLWELHFYLSNLTVFMYKKRKSFKAYL